MGSIYIHIPFCEHKCIYCDFYSLVPSETKTGNRSLEREFLSALEKEINLQAEDSRFHETYETIFFGGGTPSLLQPAEIERILNLLASKFAIREDAEITLEANPGTVDKQKLLDFRTAGVNRISIGIQSFHDSDLQFLTRIHSAAGAKQCIQDCTAAGFENISCDLIYSLPHQTIQQWKSNLEQATAHHIQHISCYSLIIEPGTPLHTMVHTNQVIPTGEEQDAEFFEFTMEYLASLGYHQYEVSNFSKPNFQCRHNQNYWNHQDYLGFGPSAHSFFTNERWWNIADVSSYIRHLNENTPAIAGREHLSESQRKEETIFLGLRSDGIDLEQFQRTYSQDLFKEYQSVMATLIQQGYAQIIDHRFKLTSRGYMICDEICQSFR